MKYSKPITIFFFMELIFLTLLLLLREGFNYVWQINSVQLIIATFIVLLALINVVLTLAEPEAGADSTFLSGAAVAILLFIPGIAFFKLSNIWIESLMIVLALIACIVGYLCIPTRKEEPKMMYQNHPEYTEIIQHRYSPQSKKSDEFIDIKELLLKEKVLEVKDKIFETELKDIEHRESEIEQRLAKMEEKTRHLEVQNQILRVIKQTPSKKKASRSRNVIRVKKISQTPKYKELQPIVIETAQKEDRYEPLINKIEKQAKDLATAEQKIKNIKNKTAPKKTKYVLVKPVTVKKSTKNTITKAQADKLVADINAQAKDLVAAENRMKGMQHKTVPKKTQYSIVKKPTKKESIRKKISKADAEKLLASIDAQAKKLVSAEKRFIKKTHVNKF